MWRVRAGMLALVIVCSTAQASNWVSLGKNDAGTMEYFIDVSSIRIEGNVRRAWFQMVHKAHTMKDPDDGRYWRSEVSRYTYNCTQEVKRHEAMTIYYEDGTNYIMAAENYPTPWTPVVPDTLSAEGMEFICRWKS